MKLRKSMSPDLTWIVPVNVIHKKLWGKSNKKCFFFVKNKECLETANTIIY